MPDMSPKKAGVLVGNFSAPGKVYTEALILLFQVSEITIVAWGVNQRATVKEASHKYSRHV